LLYLGLPIFGVGHELWEIGEQVSW
jgi:hypothetical protein